MISFNHFFGVGWDGLQPRGDAGALSMPGLYGAVSDTSLENFVYSARLDCRFVIPPATKVGTLYKGTLRLGQFFGGDTLSIGGKDLTVGNLIAGADLAQAGQSGFTLHSAMVNDYLLAHTVTNGEDVFENYFQDTNMGSEIIQYVVLETPAKNISDGQKMDFSLLSILNYNLATLPSPKNMLLYRKFSPIIHRKQRKYIDYQFQPYAPELLDSTPIPITYSGLEKFAQEDPQDMTRVAFSGVRGSSVPVLARGVSVDDDPGAKKKKKEIDSDSEEEEVKLGVIKVLSRHRVGIIYTLASNRGLYEEMGVKMPLQMAWAIPAAAAGMRLAKQVLTSDMITRLLKQGGEKFIHAAKASYKNNKNASRAVSDGIRSSLGQPLKKLKKIKQSIASIPSLLRKLVDSRNSGDEETMASISHKIDNAVKFASASGYHIDPNIATSLKRMYKSIRDIKQGVERGGSVPQSLPVLENGIDPEMLTEENPQ